MVADNDDKHKASKAYSCGVVPNGVKCIADRKAQVAIGELMRLEVPMYHLRGVLILQDE